jgi:hypothetical protein
MSVVFMVETGTGKEDPARTYRDEWMYMDAMKGDVFIEYIYIFKDNRWHVSTQKIYSTKDGYDIKERSLKKKLKL